MDNESILHIGSCAGVSQTICRQQRKDGHESDVVLFDPDRYHYGSSWHYNLSYSIPDRFKKFKKIYDIATDYDILHFHYSTALPYHLDLPLWVLKKKTIVMHFHGSDIRNKKLSPLIKRYADYIYVSTPDLLSYVYSSKKDEVWENLPRYIPNPILINDNNKQKSNEKAEWEIDIAHAPSNFKSKGTDTIKKAVNELRKNPNLRINFWLMNGFPHSDVIKTFQRADIIIDQLKIGWYGMTAIEAMSLGKPVMCYIQPDLYVQCKPPIYNITEKSIYNGLIDLSTNPTLRSYYGMAGRGYIKKYHEVSKVVKLLYQ